ncbi:MAG: alpha-hydroxy-acid oxidizing protein [Chloroflexi bacterium]|nr:MAG: alpha-hydroxy-acid oxidizing protein [Chloroflexota bacterium]
MATSTRAAASAVRLEDFEPAARSVLPRGIFDYIAGGAEDEATIAGNREAFTRYRFRFRALAGAGEPDLTSELFGARFTLPVHLAPAAIQRMCHPDGEIAAHRAASEAGVAYALSTLSSVSIEDVAAAAPGVRWFQLYMSRWPEVNAAFVERAEAAGYSAILLTVDLPKTGRRERDIRNVFSLPDGIRYANLGDWVPSDTSTATGQDPFAKDVNMQTHAALDWHDLEWLVKKTSLPVLVKGVVRGDDAQRAFDAGARGVIVSNHGGRQLDYSIATLDALPDVVNAVGGKLVVLLDGGVRRGTDVIKALCLGANGVLVGRPYLYALAAGGADGVRTMLSLLREEIALSMTLLGARSLSELSSDFLIRV